MNRTKNPDGATLIATERTRQRLVEYFGYSHDDEHTMGELTSAAISYAGHALQIISDEEIPCSDMWTFWPWDEKWWKPSPEPIRNLVKAGALIAAEIDRLQRLQKEDNHEQG